MLATVLVADAAQKQPPLQECDIPVIDEQVTVRYVVDGDTVVLQDGRALRFIGVDSPELGYDKAPDEPLALAARDRLQKLLERRRYRLGLRYDRERWDRYGRLLAHAYVEDGASVSSFLLSNGLAVQFVVPPNLWNVHCYQRQEDVARRSHQGVWRLAKYQPVESVNSSHFVAGYSRVRGRVKTVSVKKSAARIILDGGMELWISGSHLTHFNFQQLERLTGLRVEARGHLRTKGGRLKMSVRHPLSLQVLTGDER